MIFFFAKNARWVVCDFIWFVDHWTFNTSSNCFKSLLKLMGQNSIIQSSYNTGNSTMLMCSVLIDVECRSRYCYSHSHRWEKLYLSRICLMIDRAKFGSSHFLPWPRIFITETYCFIKQTFFFHVFVWVYFVSLLKTSCFILLCLIYTNLLLPLYFKPNAITAVICAQLPSIRDI